MQIQNFSLLREAIKRRESRVQYDGFYAIKKALSDPNFVLYRRSTMFESGGRLSLEEAFRLAQAGKDGLIYADAPR